ncbi:hypothetical protein [Aquimarina megaterium]|uniref:hypothetical protein n=1 Tax=Aquimarina megaterium TaxID=1443666 RepID=UPI0004700A68|nr:hypothetical protein [Aquimarina megaterium]
MTKKLLLIVILLLGLKNLNAQIEQVPGDFYEAKEYSKAISLFRAKTFLFKNVLKTTETVLQFEAIPLAAASSGELTSLLYRCESKGKEGLILGFYGDYWNNAGVSYQGYGFKNLPKEKAIEFLNKIEKAIEKNKKFLRGNNNNNNIVFDFDDMNVLIWTTSGSYRIRVYWNGFDSTWEETSYERSKRRFERKIN